MNTTNELTVPTSCQLNGRGNARDGRKVRTMARFFGRIPAIQLPALEADKNGMGGFEPNAFPSESYSSPGFANISRLSSRRKRRPLFPMTRVITPNIRDKESHLLSRAEQPFPQMSEETKTSTHGSLFANKPLRFIDPSFAIPTIDNDGQTDVSPAPAAPAVPATDQLRAAKVDKLNRHLGENIPPELVLPSRGDTCQSASDSLLPPKRRRSLNSPPFTHSSVNATHISVENRDKKRLKRSHSLSSHSVQHADSMEVSVGEFRETDCPDFGPQRQFNERQRVLNVKRARKVAQVFGREPPPELIQVLDDEKVLCSRDNNRDSISTLTSFFSTSPSSAGLTPTRPRPSSQLSSAFGEAPAPELTEPESDINHRNSLMSPLQSGDLLDHEAADSLLLRRSSVDKSNFGDRRRRAAKLTRFFGVGYDSFAPSLNPGLSSMPAGSSMHSTLTGTVNIQVRDKSRFWGFSSPQTNLKDADVVDVMKKLRTLKAA